LLNFIEFYEIRQDHYGPIFCYDQNLKTLQLSKQNEATKTRPAGNEQREIKSAGNDSEDLEHWLETRSEGQSGDSSTHPTRIKTARQTRQSWHRRQLQNPTGKYQRLTGALCVSRKSKIHWRH
jgi:hypothetical protein